MRYRVTIEGREREVDVVIAPSGAISVSLDGQPFPGEVRPVPGGISLRAAGTVRDVLVASVAPGEVQLAAGPFRARAEVGSERDKKSRASVAGGPKKELRAPMPGRVVRVLAKKGETVAAGQAVLVIEAMKMENELRAGGAALVAEVHVVEGASVEARALLVTFA
jgi:biotin carboxyl carrier protein